VQQTDSLNHLVGNGEKRRRHGNEATDLDVLPPLICGRQAGLLRKLGDFLGVFDVGGIDEKHDPLDPFGAQACKRDVEFLGGCGGGHENGESLHDIMRFESDRPRHCQQ